MRIFGSDLDELARLAEEARRIVSGVDGIADLRVEQLSGLPQLRIAIDREAAARVGLTPGEIVRAVRIGMVGEEFAEVWIGQRRYDLVLKLQDDRQGGSSGLRSLLLDGHDGARVPLAQVASIEETVGPASVRREAGSRRIAVEASAAGRDLGSVAADVKRRDSRPT